MSRPFSRSLLAGHGRSRTGRGFTFAELLTAMAVAAVLGALILVTYQQIVSRSKDTSTAASLSQITRSAQSRAGLSQADVPTAGAITAAIEDQTWVPVEDYRITGTQSVATSGTCASDPETVKAGQWYSCAPTQVSWAVDTDEGALALAVRSDTGNCVLSLSYGAESPQTWVADSDLGTACSAGVALMGPDADYQSLPTNQLEPQQAPSNLAAASVSATQVRLTWNAAAGTPAGYSVYRDGTLVAQVAGTATTYVDAPLASATTYQYNIAAKDPTGKESPKTPVVSGSTLPEAPSTPQAVVTSGAVTLTWTRSPGTITAYEVRRTNGTVVGRTEGASFTHSPVASGTEYTYAVYAESAGGVSVPSPSVTVLTAPAAPSGLSATAGNATVSLSWTPPSGTVAGYEIYATPAGGARALLKEIAAPATGTTHTAAVNGTAYTYDVIAYNVSASSTRQRSASSNTASATPLAAPAAPGGLACTPGLKAFTCSWGAVSTSNAAPVTGYRLYVGATQVCQVAAGTTSCTVSSISGVAPAGGTTYTVAVLAYGAGGEGARSTSASVTAYDYPSAPTGVSCTAGNAQAVISWTAPAAKGAAITDYTIQYSSNSGSSWTTFSDGVSTATTATVTGLSNTGYVFRVRATNAAGAGSYSATSSSCTPYTPPGTPTSVSGSGSDRSVALTWTAPAANGSPITDYVIQTSADDGTTWYTFTDGVGATASATVNSHNGVTLANGSSYVFRVLARNAAGDGTYSAKSASVVPFGVPTAPSNLTGTAGNAEFALSWTAAGTNGAAVTAYEVAYSSNSGSSWTSFSTSITTTNTTVTGLTRGSTYLFRIRARNAAGWGAWATSSAFTLPTAPGTPSPPTCAASGAGQVTVTYTAPSDGGSAITDYDVFWSSDGVNYTEFADGGSNTNLSTTVTGLTVGTSGTTYTFKVRAGNVAGDSAQSSASSGCLVYTTPATPGAPTVSATYTASPSVDHGFSISWTAPSNYGSTITAYRARVLNAAQTTEITACTTSGSPATTSCSVTGLAAGTTYYVSVHATNAAGDTSYGTATGMTTSGTVVRAAGAGTDWTVPVGITDSNTTLNFRLAGGRGSTGATQGTGGSTETFGSGRIARYSYTGSFSAGTVFRLCGGGAGGTTTQAAGGTGGYNGGAAGGSTGGYGSGGGGGGASDVRTTSTACNAGAGTRLAVAAGGGGAGGRFGDGWSNGGIGNAGNNGAGSAGTAGACAYLQILGNGGAGGNNGSGGSGGLSNASGNPCSSSNWNANNGSSGNSWQGGAGAYGAGGGGGGYGGGGGGGNSADKTYAVHAGGGGGGGDSRAISNATYAANINTNTGAGSARVCWGTSTYATDTCG